MSQYNIMMIFVNHRKDSAISVQNLLTKHGCAIKTRIGLHETSAQCAEDGLILLQLEGELSEFNALEKDLKQLDGVQTKLVQLGE